MNTEKSRLPEARLTITDRYLDRLGREIPKEELLPDLSNVCFMERTEEMTYPEFERRFPKCSKKH